LPVVVTSLLLVLLVAIAFFPCLRNEFVAWDDDQNFLENPSYRGLGWAQIRWDWTSFRIGVYQPLAWMILGAQYICFGLKPWGYHLASLILYGVATVVLFVLTLTLLRRCRFHSGQKPEEPRLLAIAAGLAVGLFAVHPLRTEVVAWASCQPYLPCAVFWMLAVLAYLRAFPEGEAPRWGWLVGAYALFVAALLSKAVAVSLPAVFLILDVYPLRRLGGGPGRWFGAAVRRVWWEKIPFAAVSVLFMGLAILGRTRDKHIASVQQWGIAARLAQSCYGIWFYLIKTVLPTNITACYPVPERVDWLEAPFAASILGTLGMSTALFLLRRRWPDLLAVWLSYLVILAPNLGMVRTSTQIAADRYSYIAMIGGVVLLAAGLRRALDALPRGALTSGALIAASLAGLLGLVMLTQAQCATWRTSEALWTHILTHGGGRSERAHDAMGALLLRQGRFDESRVHVELALQINPNLAGAHNNLGAILRSQGRNDEARAHFNEALRLDPDMAGVHNNLAAILLDQGRIDEAKAEFEEVLRRDPEQAGTHFNVGMILMGQGRGDEARAHFAETVRINPNHPEAHYQLGILLLGQGRIAEARTQFDETLRINPNFARAYNNRAMIRATAADARYRDGPRAVEDATHACTLTGWKNAAFLDTLAAAHAEAADFETAEKWQTRAIDLLTDEAQKDDFRSRLKLYQARQPYHEPIGAR
jgi:tetratricopeptide (TPR) repeat protein